MATAAKTARTADMTTTMDMELSEWSDTRSLPHWWAMRSEARMREPAALGRQASLCP